MYVHLQCSYHVIQLISLQCYFMYTIVSKYLLCMDILYTNVVISIISSVWNAALHYVLMYHLGYGVRGSAIALTSSFAMSLVLTLLFIVVSKAYRDTWRGEAHCSLHVTESIRRSCF